MKKSIWILTVTIVIIAVGGISYQLYQQGKLSSLNIMLTGVVDSTFQPAGFGGSGVIKLTILNSNTIYYDVRKRHKYYYCIINSKDAWLLESHALFALKGDTLQLDIHNRKLKWLNKNRINPEHLIWMIIDDSFYKAIANYTRQIK